MARRALTIRSTLVGFGLAFIVSVPCACQRGTPDPTRAAPSASARVADPRAYPRERLVEALATVQLRWQKLGELPDCAEELRKSEERALCTLAQRELGARKALAPDASTSDSSRLELAAKVALSTQRAGVALRANGVNRLLEARPTPSGAPSAVSAPDASAGAPAAARRIKPTPSASGPDPHPHARREQSDPYLDAIQAYARVTTVAFAELRAYLEFGEAGERGAALSQLETLATQQPHWAALRALINEAHLVEADPALKQRLSALRTRLGIP